MRTKIRRMFLRIVRSIFSDKFREPLTKFFSKKFVNQLYGAATDSFLDFLLRAMDVLFFLWDDYRENINDFEGTYVFRTSKGAVAASVTFKNGDMKIPGQALDHSDVRVTFKDPKSLRSFLFSDDQDILDSILDNTVDLDGNLNYIFKFGFMVRDLEHRLGVLYE